jgi:hypothetical protein
VTRDLTKKQFAEALERGSFVAQGFLGYYRLPIEGHNVCVSIWNAGTRRRDQLAYLHQQTKKYRRTP